MTSDGRPIDEQALRAVAREVYARLQPHAHKPHLELEVRLCTLSSHTTARDDSSSAGDGDGDGAGVVRPHIVQGRPHGTSETPTIRVGVTADDFARVVQRVCRAQADGTPTNRAATTTTTPTWRTTVEVRDTHGVRHTYAPRQQGDDDSNNNDNIDVTTTPLMYVTAVRKKRLRVEDIVLPGAAYDVRIALSSEDSDAASLPRPSSRMAAAMARGYRRVKDRLHVREGAVAYDLTRVRSDDADGETYEVEVEYVGAGDTAATAPADAVSYQTVLSTLRCAVQLACMDGLQGARAPSYHV